MALCDRAVKDLEDEKRILKSLVEVKNQELDARSKEISRLRARDDSLLSNPYFMFGAGLLVGGLTYSLIKK